MAAIMEQQQGVRQGRRRAKKTEFRWSKLLLLLCFFSYSGTSAEHVTGTKGGSVTLSCELQDHEISVLVLSRRSKNILVCQNDECKNVNDSKVFKKGSCDIMLKDLIFSDAGKYILRVYHNNTQAQVEQQAMEYHLHIHDEISVEIDEKVQLDVLIIDADKVEHQNINSTEWTEVWTRGHGFSSDRLTVRDGNLIILQFTVTDTGTYRVLDSNNKILITVTVTITESSPQSKGEVIDTEQHAVESWIIVVSVIGVLLVVALISAVFCICRRQHKNTEHERIEYYTAVQNI